MPGVSKETVQLARTDPQLLHSVYKEIGETLGVDVAAELYQLFKGQQITFPMRFLDAEGVRKKILREYDGTNIKKLAAKYGYAEKTVRRMIRESAETL